MHCITTPRGRLGAVKTQVSDLPTSVSPGRIQSTYLGVTWAYLPNLDVQTSELQSPASHGADTTLGLHGQWADRARISHQSAGGWGATFTKAKAC